MTPPWRLAMITHTSRVSNGKKGKKDPPTDRIIKAFQARKNIRIQRGMQKIHQAL